MAATPFARYHIYIKHSIYVHIQIYLIFDKNLNMKTNYYLQFTLKITLNIICDDFCFTGNHLHDAKLSVIGTERL